MIISRKPCLRNAGAALLLTLALVIGLVPFAPRPAALAFYPDDVHIPVFRSQLAAKFSPEARAWVEAGLSVSDGPAGQLRPELHFDNAKDPAQICQRWKAGPQTLLDKAASSAVEAFRKTPAAAPGVDRVNTNRELALGFFGQYLHAIQDFYAHSNWIELAVAGNTMPAVAPIQNACDPATLPNGLTTGYFDLLYPTDFCGPTTAQPGGQPPPRPPAGSGFILCHGPADDIKLPEPPKVSESHPIWGSLGSMVNSKLEAAKSTVDAAAQGIQSAMSTLPANLMLAKDVSNKYHGKDALTLPNGATTTHYQEAVRLATAATAAPETWAFFHDRTVSALKTNLPDRDAECLFQVLIKGGDPTCPLAQLPGCPPERPDCPPEPVDATVPSVSVARSRFQ